MSKTSAGRFFEDYRLGEVIEHAVPRTVGAGERALYHALYPARHAISSSDEFAKSCGLAGSPLDELIAFHLVFGKTVPDISLNAVANLGYSQAHWLAPVWPGDTLRSVSEIIGLKQNSSGKNGVVWVRTKGINQHDECVLEYVRWVMVKKRDQQLAAPKTSIPDLASVIAPDQLTIPTGLDFSNYNFSLAGEPHRLSDYRIGEQIDHVDGVTIEESEHMLATRLWQNTAKVHFDINARPDGKRLIYGGHIISLARALSFNGLANAQMIVGLNAGSHVNPCFAGDTVRAWSEVLDISQSNAPGVGLIRLRTVATKAAPFELRDNQGKYLPDVVLDIDYWAVMPT